MSSNGPRSDKSALFEHQETSALTILIPKSCMIVSDDKEIT